MKRKTKATNKDIVFNIASNRRLIMEVSQRIQWLEDVTNKYIEMKKDTKKFNKFLQDSIMDASEDAEDTK
tara:strand:+ start:292 stop:501 length:210 start_codon:yes stop_codon:yes gene_type:complete